MNTIRTENQNGIVIVTFDEPNSPVNTMGEAWQADMDALAAQLAAEKDQIRGIVLASAKSTFFAGADLKGVMRMDAQEAPRRFFAEIELKIFDARKFLIPLIKRLDVHRTNVGVALAQQIGNKMTANESSSACDDNFF